MDERQDDKRVKAKVDEGIWCLVRTSSRMAFARLRGIQKLDDKERDKLYGTIKNNSGVEFDVVLDYFSPIRPVPVLDENGQMRMDPRTRQPATAMGRETIVTNFEFVMEPFPMKLFGIECCVPLQDMQKRDKHLAEQHIDEALKTLDARRAADAGIVTPAGPVDSNAALQAILQKAIEEGKPLPPGVTRLPDTPDGKPHFKIDMRHGASPPK